jgi:uncharacterized secreted protein with C-terminal beta-propeller domain
MSRVRVSALAAAAAVALAPAGADAAKRPTGKAALQPFANCAQVAAYGRRHARAWRPTAPPIAARPSIPMPMPVFDESTAATGAPVPAAAPAAPEAERGGGGEDFSLTNNQEAGVYEADSVKTDGRYLYTATAGRLHVTDTTGGTAQAVGSLALGDGFDTKLLLRGKRLLVMWQATTPQPLAQAAVAPAILVPTQTVLAEVDVSDPAVPVLRRTVTLDGSLLAARRIGPMVRLVLQGAPRAETQPQQADPAAASAWLPKARFADARGARTKTRKLVRCNAVRRPKAFSGLTTTTVVTLDLESGLDPVDADTIVADGETVYASAQNLFVASRTYAPALERRTDGSAPEVSTSIHRFAIDEPRRTTYQGSGQVPGYLLSQFALSDRAGALRVASTDVPPWFSDTGREADSQVTVLRTDENAMPKIGEVGGLGPGERIYAVRFLDTAAFVVTFRQVDPLYTIDLTDPANPRKVGELKLPGYSAYLHPVGPGRVLGVGQDANARGRTTGAQVTLFDVADLANPKVLQQATVGGGSSSQVEQDHLAFLYWAPRNLVVFPIDVYGDRARDSFSGAIGFTIGDGGIAEAGRVSHPGGGYVTREVVVGDVLYTTSERGVGATRLDGWGDAGFAAYAAG